MILTFLSFQQPVDTAYWNRFAKRIAKRVKEEGGEDAIYDIRYVEDSTGKYIIFNKRWVYTTPSGYKIFYRTPVAIEIPKNAPGDIDKRIISELEKGYFTKEKLLEMTSIGLGCGIVTLGAIVSLIFGMNR